MRDLAGRRFLVTGGSKGIGRAIARSLVDLGAEVAIMARSRDRLERTAAAIGTAAVVADVGREEDVARSVREAVELLGGLDGLVNNAAIAAPMEVAAMDARAFRRVLDVNVVGPALMVREVLPHLHRAGGGDIVNISSTSGLRGDRAGTIYCASKFALRGMSQCWQAELRPHDIRVIHVNPSAVQTGFGTPVDPSPRRPNRLHPEDIAHAVVSCLTMERRGFVPELTIYATNPW